MMKSREESCATAMSTAGTRRCSKLALRGFGEMLPGIRFGGLARKILIRKLVER